MFSYERIKEKIIFLGIYFNDNIDIHTLMTIFQAYI